MIDEGRRRVPRAEELAAQRVGSGELVARREGNDVAVTKRYVLGGDRMAPWLEVAVGVELASTGERAREFELDLEWAFDLLGGGANPMLPDWLVLPGTFWK